MKKLRTASLNSEFTGS